MFFVAGITGHVGGAAAHKLLEQGHTVRTLARDPQKAAEWARQGVDVRQGDFTDPAAVAAALEGVEGAYLMMPPDPGPVAGLPGGEGRDRQLPGGAGEGAPTPARPAVVGRLGEEQRPGQHHLDPPDGRGAGRLPLPDRLRPGRRVLRELRRGSRRGGGHRRVLQLLPADGPRRSR